MNKPNQLYNPNQSTNTAWHQATVTRQRRAELSGTKRTQKRTAVVHRTVRSRFVNRGMSKVIIRRQEPV